MWRNEVAQRASDPTHAKMTLALADAREKEP
jgi:hypothetical protein